MKTIADPQNCGKIVKRGEGVMICRERRGVYRLWASQPGSGGQYRPIRYLTRREMMAV